MISDPNAFMTWHTMDGSTRSSEPLTTQALNFILEDLH